MRITHSEAVVMDCLWQSNPLTANQIIAAIAEPHGWQEATVRTLINRLLNKQAIVADKDGRSFLYRPLLQREDYLSTESQGLLDRLFDGRVSSLVTHFSQSEQLSADEIAELKRLVEGLDDER